MKQKTTILSIDLPDEVALGQLGDRELEIIDQLKNMQSLKHLDSVVAAYRDGTTLVEGKDKT